MPFKSQAQQKWMHANHPEMAKRWEAETPDHAKLPERVGAKRPAPAVKDIYKRNSKGRIY